jgi:hypothetical protein
VIVVPFCASRLLTPPSPDSMAAEPVGWAPRPRAGISGVIIATEAWRWALATCRRRDAPSYSAMAEEVRAVVPTGTTVLTDNRMWPALRDRDPRSLFLLFYWTNPKIAGDDADRHRRR